MRPRRSDDAVAVLLAVLVHLAIVAVLFAGLWWTRSAAPPAAGGAVQADVVDPGALPTSMRRALARTPEVAEPEPEPLPEPEPEPEPDPVPVVEPEPEPPAAQPEPQQLLPEPAPVDRDEVVETPTPVKATETAPQKAQHRQEQVELKEQAEQQQRAQRLAREREAQLAEIRRRREAAAREAQLAQQRAEQLSAAQARASRSPAPADAPASAGTDDGLRARYAAALQEAIRSKWTRPDNIPPGALCVLRIRQLPGGEVVDAQVDSPCVFDEQGRRSIEAAVLKAQPLPYAGFESVFARNVTIRFRAD